MSGKLRYIRVHYIYSAVAFIQTTCSECMPKVTGTTTEQRWDKVTIRMEHLLSTAMNMESRSRGKYRIGQ